MSMKVIYPKISIQSLIGASAEILSVCGHCQNLSSSSPLPHRPEISASSIAVFPPSR